MRGKVRVEVRSGARAIVPLAIGVGVYGLAFGLLAFEGGFTWIEAGLMGALVFGGSSQIVAVERMAAGTGVTTAFIAGIALNLRLLLITASVRDLFVGRPLWQQIIGAHLSSDENWALTLARRALGQPVGYWFLIGAGLTLIVTWVVATVIGVLFASRIPDPETYAIDFAFTAAFIAISRSLWRGHADILPWLTAAFAVVMTTRLGLFDSSWSIVIGGVAGSLVAGLKHHD